MKRPFLVVLVAAFLLLAGCAGDPALENASPADGGGGLSADVDSGADAGGAVDGELEIHHVDVGQADATLLREPSGETMLIDSGDWPQDGADVIEYLEAHGVDRIDHLVATHAHADHIGGHAAIIEHYETERGGIGAVYDSGVASSSQTYQGYLDAVEAHDVSLYTVEDGDDFAFGNASVDVYNPPTSGGGDDLNANSVVLQVQFGDFSYLTTGDVESGVERRLVDYHGDALESDAYQAGHHGSSTSSSAPFVDRVDPAVAIISSGYDSSYGHPHEETLADYADRGIETYWTGVHGDVVLTTDGEGYDVETEREFSSDPADLLAERSTVDAGSLAPPVFGAAAPISG